MFITNALNDSVSTLVGTTVEGTLEVGSLPLVATYDPSNADLYVSNVGPSATNVTVISVSAYSVTFTEAGLPVHTGWSVTLGNETQNSTGATISFYGSNGSYYFTVQYVSAGNRFYIPAPPAGNVTVSGANLSVSVAYTSVPEYELSFNETGLPVGKEWTAEVSNDSTGDLANNSTTGTVSFPVPNGTYAFSITSTCYQATPASGSVVVAGGNLTQNVTFAPDSHPCVVLLASFETTLGGFLGGDDVFPLNFTVPNGASHELYVWNLAGAFLPSALPQLPDGMTFGTALVGGQNGVPVGGSQGIAIGSLAPGTYTTSLAYGGWVNTVTIAAYAVYGDAGYGYDFASASQSTILTMEPGAYDYVAVEGTGGTYPVTNSSFTEVDVEAASLVGGDTGLIGQQASNQLSFSTRAGGFDISAVAIIRGYLVTLSETGLKPAVQARWGVTIGGAQLPIIGATVTVDLANGTYGYIVHGPTGYRVSEALPTGNLTVNGVPLSATFGFARGATHSVTFSRTGVPEGTFWCVALGATFCSIKNRISVKNLTPGSYPYDVLPVAGYIRSVEVDRLASPTNGWLDLGHAGATVATRFTPPTYPLAFSETGLKSGTRWTVEISGPFNGVEKTETRSSRTTTISFEVPNGSFAYTIKPVHGYPTPSPGAVEVQGSPLSVGVSFAASESYSLIMSNLGQTIPGAGTFYITLGLEPTAGLTTGLFGISVTTVGDEAVGPGAVPASCALGAPLDSATCPDALAGSNAWYVVLVASNGTVANSYGSGGWNSASISVTAAQNMVVVSGASLAAISDMLNLYSTSSSTVSGSVSL